MEALQLTHISQLALLVCTWLEALLISYSKPFIHSSSLCLRDPKQVPDDY